MATREDYRNYVGERVTPETVTEAEALLLIDSADTWDFAEQEVWEYLAGHYGVAISDDPEVMLREMMNKVNE